MGQTGSSRARPQRRRWTQWDYRRSMLACAGIFYAGAARILRALWVAHSSGSSHTLYYDFLSKGAGGRSGALERMTTPAEALRGGELFLSVMFVLISLFILCLLLLPSENPRSLKPPIEREARGPSTCGG